jgi:hypothetical protein
MLWKRVFIAVLLAETALDVAERTISKICHSASIAILRTWYMTALIIIAKHVSKDGPRTYWRRERREGMSIVGELDIQDLYEEFAMSKYINAAHRDANVLLEIKRLRAENATLSESVTSQALLIASLKEDLGLARIVLEQKQALLSSSDAILSDTQRQNAELMQRVGEAEKDAERWRYWRTKRSVTLVTAIFGNGCISKTVEMAEAEVDAAVAASKVSNEVASPRKDETIACKGDEND